MSVTQDVLVDQYLTKESQYQMPRLNLSRVESIALTALFLKMLYNYVVNETTGSIQIIFMCYVGQGNGTHPKLNDDKETIPKTSTPEKSS